MGERVTMEGGVDRVPKYGADSVCRYGVLIRCVDRVC